MSYTVPYTEFFSVSSFLQVLFVWFACFSRQSLMSYGLYMLLEIELVTRLTWSHPVHLRSGRGESFLTNSYKYVNAASEYGVLLNRSS